MSMDRFFLDTSVKFNILSVIMQKEIRTNNALLLGELLLLEEVKLALV